MIMIYFDQIQLNGVLNSHTKIKKIKISVKNDFDIVIQYLLYYAMLKYL
jgi:hypothetical protein